MSANGRPIRMAFEPLRSIAASAIPGGTYVGGNIGNAVQHSVVQFKIDNLTDALLVFSLDGLTDHFVVPSNSFWLSDVSSNQITQQGLQIPKGEIIYVKQIDAPSTGKVYLSIVYADLGNK